MSLLPLRRVTAAAGLSLVATTAGLALAPAALAADPLPAPVAPASVVAGASFTVNGTACPTLDEAYPAFAVVLTDEALETDDLVIGESDANGAWSVTLSFPTGTPAGAHQIGAVCSQVYGTEGTEYPFITTTVTAPATTPTPAPSTDTNDTGTDTGTDTATPATPAKGAIKGASANTAGIAPTSTSVPASAVVPGKEITKILKGFQPFEVVTLVMHSTPTVLGTFTADANGVVTATYTIPAGTTEADHTFVYDGNKGSYFQETVHVGTGTTTASSSNLAYTGASVAVPLALGGALVIAGSGALLVSRRRTGATQA
ncbi:hypothetical protein [Modestobacter lapidis]|nr:hypothetical protein [Modestobacter lapidis]